MVGWPAGMLVHLLLSLSLSHTHLASYYRLIFSLLPSLAVPSFFSPPSWDAPPHPSRHQDAPEAFLAAAKQLALSARRLLAVDLTAGRSDGRGGLRDSMFALPPAMVLAASSVGADDERYVRGELERMTMSIRVLEEELAGRPAQ